MDLLLGKLYSRAKLAHKFPYIHGPRGSWVESCPTNHLCCRRLVGVRSPVPFGGPCCHAPGREGNLRHTGWPNQAGCRPRGRSSSLEGSWKRISLQGIYTSWKIHWKHRTDPLGKRKIFCAFWEVILLVKVMPKCKSYLIDHRRHMSVSPTFFLFRCMWCFPLLKPH